MTDQDTDLGNEVPAEVLKTAREMGWTPQEKFKGNPEKWVDAQTYVDRADHILPILRADRDRLKRDLLTRDTEIGTLKQQMQTTNALVKDLTVQYDTRLQAELAAQRTRLKATIKEAIEDRDTDAELDAREQLEQLTVAEREAQDRAKKNKDKLTTSTTPVDDKGDPQPQLSADFMAWQKDNSWYGGTGKEDRQRTKAIMRIAEDLRDEGETVQGREFMDLCLEKLEEAESSTGSQRSPSKVESGNPRNNGGGQTGSYASLPAAAKAACEEFAQDLVGEGKVYKTLPEFQKYYAKTYFESN